MIDTSTTYRLTGYWRRSVGKALAKACCWLLVIEVFLPVICQASE